MSATDNLRALDDHTISAGPGKFDLMTALFVKSPHHLVQFVTDKGLIFTAMITGVEAEDSSGESWNLKGFTSDRGPELRSRFVAHLNTQTRRGQLHFRKQGEE